MGYRPAFARNLTTPPPGAALAGRVPGTGGAQQYFSHGRTALKFGLARLGFQPGDRLLVPDLICDVVVLVLERLGIEPVYYSVGRNLEPDWDRLHVPAAAKGLLMVHYFGMPQPVERFIAFCREHGLLLIEDNAHGYGGRYGDRRLGEFGDIGISSPWKNFPIPDGGLLHASGPGPAPTLPAAARRLPSRRQLLERFKRGWIAYQRYYSHGLQEVPPTAIGPDRAMGAPARALLAEQDLDACSARRREIYSVWDQWARGAGLQPVFDTLPAGAAPLVHAAYCNTPEDRHRRLEWLWRNDIDAYTWPKLPPRVLDSGSGAREIWARLLCLPIHQYMAPAALEEHLQRIPWR